MALREFELAGRSALVTGAGRGIGKGIALTLAEAGADVAVTALTQSHAVGVAEQIGHLGRRGLGMAADATRLNDMGKVAEQVLAQFGHLDVLVNCVGDSIPGLVAPQPHSQQQVMDEDDWHRIIDINLTEAFIGCRALGAHLLERRSGCVINIASFAALRPRPGAVAYATAKAGLTRFTDSLALEWAPYGVRVNAIAPGLFPDPEDVSEEFLRRQETRALDEVPLGRYGRLREVGLMAVFLASDAAAYVTGQMFCVDGGWTLKWGGF
jgi:NAD(P)-dependent dehydrogenase (short-subunit alcohol dehydrogenase family)